MRVARRFSWHFFDGLTCANDEEKENENWRSQRRPSPYLSLPASSRENEHNHADAWAQRYPV